MFGHDRQSIPVDTKAMKLMPFGEFAWLVDCPESSHSTATLARGLGAEFDRRGLTGIRTIVPAASSVLVEFDPSVDPEVVAAAIRAGFDRQPNEEQLFTRLRIIPTVYGGEYGPDLADVARLTGLSTREIILLHVSPVFTVEFLGFSPGFAYLANLPPEISVPRLTTPREKVQAGSVAIAEGRCAIYPQATPGGWRVIGRTAMTLFDPQRDPPTYLSPGDSVRFREIGEDEWTAGYGVATDW